MREAVQLGLNGQAAVVGARPEDDFYRTTQWLIDAIATPFRACTFGSVLDAGAGDGRLGGAFFGMTPPGGLTLVELDPVRAPKEAIVADFLAWAPKCGRTFDLVISNPPFRLWDEFVRAALLLLAPNGTLLVLGFVNVLGGQRRAAWWRANPPTRIWLSPRRASFTADGQTDSRDCAWFEWGPGGRRAEVRWLPTEGGR